MWFDGVYGKLTLKGLTKKLAKYDNNIEFINSYTHLVNLTLERFKWENLPDTCNPRFLELSLLLYGTACIVQYKEDEYINLATRVGGNFNIYGEPLEGFGYGMNGYIQPLKFYTDSMDSNITRTGVGLTQDIKGYNAVLCKNNKQMIGFEPYIYNTARRVADLMRTMDVITKGLKSPVLIACPESAVNSFKEFISKTEENESFIITTRTMDSDQIKAFDMKQSPESLSILWQHRVNILNEYLEFIGINTLKQHEKKERLLVDEANANNQYINDNIRVALEERKIFCDRVNTAFNLNISVKLNEEGQNGGKNDVLRDSGENNTSEII